MTSLMTDQSRVATDCFGDKWPIILVLLGWHDSRNKHLRDLVGQQVMRERAKEKDCRLIVGEETGCTKTFVVVT